MLPEDETGNRTRAVIVGDGPTALGFTPPDDITIIAVNGSVEWLTRADYFFTLDPCFINLSRMQNRRKGVKYCAAGLDSPIRGVKRYERISLRGDEPTDTESPEWWLWRWSAVRGLSEKKTQIHSGNSAYGALGLAYHLGFSDVALVGVDATSERRIGGGQPNNLSHLPLLFSSALPQINVVSCGALGGIPRMRFEEWLEATC
ncbi:TPA: norphogenetic protein [Citrobacter sedlakii]|nr:norphogenetic protein [Citrobacter sedlakii]HCA7134030.1 norphogenetic protein [Citrobacter sedlakii]HCA7180164.1 norphogenetic protein [Citrobacter sedlakii]